MHIKTATDSSRNNALKVTVIIYGSEGKTREIQLVQPDLKRECFLPGFEDGFFVSKPNVSKTNQTLKCSSLFYTSDIHHKSCDSI